MNREEAKGYLLACCDEIDRMCENNVLKSNDIACRMSKYLREYLSVRNCPFCNKLLTDSEFHYCYTNSSTSTK